MNIGRSATSLFASRLIIKALSFAAVIYFSRELGTAGIGVFFLFQGVVGILSLVSDFGVLEGVEKYASEDNNKSQLIGAGVIIKLLLTSILIVFIFLFDSQVNSYIGTDASLLLALAIFLNGFGMFFIRILRAEMRVGETGILLLLRQIVFLCLSVVLLVFGFEVNSLIISFVLSYGVLALMGYVRFDSSVSLPNYDTLSKIVNYGKYSFIGAVGGSFYSWVDVAVIGFFLSSEFVGAYEIAWQVSSVIVLFSSSIGMALFPKVSKWSGENDSQSISKAISEMLTPALFFGLPSIVGAVLLGEQLLTIVFGEGFSIASNVLIIFMFIKTLQSFSLIIARTVRAMDFPEVVAKARGISAVTNVVMNVLLVSYFGIMGAAVATSLSYIFYTTYNYKFLKNKIDIIIPYRNLVWFGVSSLVMGLIVITIKKELTLNGSYSLFLVISVGVATYTVTTMAYRDVRIDLLTFVKNLLST